MAISTEIEYAAIDELYLDPKNPRLGRNRVSPNTSQEDLLRIMREWVLDELALSYLESGGFWTHEPLIVVEEELYGERHLVVVEGNRRLAALRALREAREGRPSSSKWREMIQDSQIPGGLFERIPYVRADSRLEVQAFLGFRHVTGIKQWGADEKAGFIAKLIDESNMTYREVARKIGSKAPTVRKHYVAYRLLLQMEDEVEDFEPEKAEKRFAVLYMSIEKQGVQHYLHIDYQGDPSVNKRPVPSGHLENLAHFARWLFGTAEAECIVKDTRQVGDFGTILESDEAVAYLEGEREPKFDVAFRISGGDEHEIIRYVNEASNRVELALTRAHAFKDSSELRKEVRRLGDDVRQLLSIFPDIKAELFKEDAE